MRGKKTGVESRIQSVVPDLLDIDGNSYQHMHNTTKTLCKELEQHLDRLFFDLHTDDHYSPDQRSALHDKYFGFIGIHTNKV